VSVENPVYCLPQNDGNARLAKAHPERFSLTEGKRIVPVKKAEPGFVMAQSEEEVKIFYDNKPSLYRAYGELLADPDQKEIIGNPGFQRIGLHIDLSRGAVYKPDYLKNLNLHLALSGIGTVASYTEYFEVGGHPKIQADQLSKREIRDVARSAQDEFGIEYYPSIQTLAHGEKIFRHEEYRHLQYRQPHEGQLGLYTFDPRKPEIYPFISSLINNASEPYLSNRINIGCDEADVGDELFVRHVKRVHEIAKCQMKEVIIWSDKLGRLPAHLLDQLPKDMAANYWEYDSDNVDHHRSELRRLKESGFTDLIASPGAQSWNGPYPDLQRAEVNIDAMLAAAKQEAVHEVLLTQWGDNGSESPLRASLPTIIYFGERAWNGEVVKDKFEKKVAAFTGNSYADFLLPVGIERGVNRNMRQQLVELQARAHPDNAALFGYTRAYGDFHHTRVIKNRTALLNAHKKVWMEERKEEGFTDLYPFAS
jgi:hypothetical protein